jgi:endonuclease/exonuclease/phosphatase family metal-dependent hydrolase
MLRFLAALVAVACLSVAAHADDQILLKIMTFNIWYGGEQVSFTQVARAIRAADPDIIGIQEPDGNIEKLAQAAGYSYVDPRRHIISRYPIFDSGSGERLTSDPLPYSLAGVDADHIHAWILVRPGKVIAFANTHLTSDPYGPEAVRDGKTADEVLQIEKDTRLSEAQPLADGLSKLAKDRVPTFLTGDFNSPSYLDWTAAVMAMRPAVKFPLLWPASKAIADAGFTDSYRFAHPDPIEKPGFTWTAGYPSPYVRAEETHDRIDFIWAAYAETLESRIVGEGGNPDTDIAIDPWPSDHRAVVSTFKVTPIDAPALIAVEPRPVVEGGTFRIRANMPDHADWTGVVTPRGGDPAKDAITGIADVGLWDRPTIKLSTLGLAPGKYDAVLLDAGKKEVARTRFQIMARDARPEVTADKASYKPGESIKATWQNAPGYRFDWIGVYAKADPNVYNYYGYVYTGARFDGETVIDQSVFSAPLAAGDYELRLMSDDHYEVEATAPFTVTDK